MNINRNFAGFIWHAFWLALAETFAEKNTVLPGLILLAGGTQTDVGILTSIMIGVPLFSQIIFASYLTNKPLKKKFLLGGIFLRASAFAGVAFSIFYFDSFTTSWFILIIFIWMTLFALSGAFAGVSYTDIVGKSFDNAGRKKFFVTHQFLSGIGILISAVIVKEILAGIEYPQNYQAAFFTASGLLFLASIGFMILKEKPSDITVRYKSIFAVIRIIPAEIKASANLKYFILTTNLIGLTAILIPFYVGFIKQSNHLDEGNIGTFLLFQIIGMITSNLLWHKLVKIFSFKGMLRTAIVLLSMLPVLALLVDSFNSLNLFYILFFLAGSAISAQKIAQEGVIIEISNEANRPLYTGIYGTLNLSSVLLPLLLGLILDSTGYTIVFILLSVTTISALRLANKMVCPVDLEKS